MLDESAPHACRPVGAFVAFVSGFHAGRLGLDENYYRAYESLDACGSIDELRAIVSDAIESGGSNEIVRSVDALTCHLQAIKARRER